MWVETGRRIALAAIAAVAVVAATIAANQYPVIAPALIAVVVGSMVLAGKPRAALVAWLLAVCMVPYWVGTTGFGYIPAQSYVGVFLLILAAGKYEWKPNRVDLLLWIVVAVGLVAVTLGGSSQGSWLITITHWVIGYLVGKVLAAQAGLAYTYKAITVILAIVGALAVIEGILGWHPFTGLAASNNAYDTWARIQERGGLARSEWAFGHSLALGGALALGLAFAVRSDMKRFQKTLACVCLAAGIASTFSRAALIAGALTLILSLLSSKTIRGVHKLFLLAVSASALWATVALLAPVFEAAGDEAGGSVEYRLRAVAQLLGTFAPAGIAGSADIGESGTTFGGFNSIDNALLGVALDLGWVVAGALLLGVVVLAWRFLGGKSTPAEVALLGQLPMLASVAFITQYQVLVWFVAGIAVAASRVAPAPPIEARPGSRLAEFPR